MHVRTLFYYRRDVHTTISALQNTLWEFLQCFMTPKWVTCKESSFGQGFFLKPEFSFSNQSGTLWETSSTFCENVKIWEFFFPWLSLGVKEKEKKKHRKRWHQNSLHQVMEWWLEGFHRWDETIQKPMYCLCIIHDCTIQKIIHPIHEIPSINLHHPKNPVLGFHGWDETVPQGSVGQ